MDPSETDHDQSLQSVIDAWQSASFSVSADPIFEDQMSSFDVHADPVSEECYRTPCLGFNSKVSLTDLRNRNVCAYGVRKLPLEYPLLWWLGLVACL